MVVLDFRSFDEGSQLTGTTVGCDLLQIGEATFHIVAEDLAGPFGGAEVGNRVVDVIGQVALCLAQVGDLLIHPKSNPLN